MNKAKTVLIAAWKSQFSLKILVFNMILIFALLAYNVIPMIEADMENQNNRMASGTLVSKEFTPGHWEFKFYYEDQFTIGITDGTRIYYTNVTKESFDKVKINEQVNLHHYVLGKDLYGDVKE